MCGFIFSTFELVDANPPNIVHFHGILDFSSLENNMGPTEGRKDGWTNTAFKVMRGRI